MPTTTLQPNPTQLGQAPSIGGHFPKVEDCRIAARLLHDGWREDFTDDQGRARSGSLTAACSIGVTPGGLVLRKRLRPDGREVDVDQADEHVHHVTVAGIEYARFRGEVLERPTTITKALEGSDLCPSCGSEVMWAFLQGVAVTAGHDLGPEPAWHGPEHHPRAPEPRRPARWWSDRSRARMVRTLASVDWSPVFTTKGCRPAMITLTYPGDWLTVAPDADTAKDQLRRFHERLRRLYARLGLEDPAAVWKLEFQRRGAPHFHVYAPVPVARFPRRAGSRDLVTFREWLSSTWAAVVDHPDPEERKRHLQAGTGLDFAEGARCSDPKRLAVYFTRHNAKGGRAKAYQHRVPDGWESAGRWWDTWGVGRIEEEAPITGDELVQVKRLLRAWSRRARSRPGRDGYARTTTRIAPRKVPRGVTANGVIRYRWVSRRYVIRSLAGSLGGFVICNDGPELAAMVARFLEQLRAEANC